MHLTSFSVKHPWLVTFAVLVMTVLLGLQMPKVHFDNDPENMLAADEPVRVFHNEIKKKYDLYDFVIVGIVNESHPDGIFNTETLGRIHKLTGELSRLHQTENGLPAVVPPSQSDRVKELNLAPQSTWKRMLNVAFQHNPNALFDENGNSVIITREIISPSVVDNIKQADLGSLKIAYLMENPPTTREEALTIRDDAMANPLYSGTLVSEDEKAICLYLPITAKHYSHNVANLVRELTSDWTGDDQLYITGLPVAEDTFGVEMLIQMATSAPMAGVAIFLLMLLFFRRFSLIVAPMVVAMVSVICTMGLLIGLGFDVHIMSSMIAIFLMPIAVADAIHILSEFFDTYHRFNDKGKTIKYVIGHLFQPMLFTSLTTIAGFASLGATPIPPVRVFGLHVAFGVGLAWLLSMTLIPAYIMLFVPEKSLAGLKDHHEVEKPSVLTVLMARLGRFSYNQWKMILVTTALLLVVAVYGISRIQVNDNPVKWFTPNHEIRVADRVLNHHFGGTYTAYLTLEAPKNETYSFEQDAAAIAEMVMDRLETTFPEESAAFRQILNQFAVTYKTTPHDKTPEIFAKLAEQAARLDENALASWNVLADHINYLDTDGLTPATLQASMTEVNNAKQTDIDALTDKLAENPELKGEPLLEAALAVCDAKTRSGFAELVRQAEIQLTAPAFKQPEMLAYLERLQQYLANDPLVGKSSSAVDALKKASYELNFRAVPTDATEAESELLTKQNKANFAIPDNAAAVGQVFTQLEGMKKKDSLFHLITRDYQAANIWVQLKSGDNRDMEGVVHDVETFFAENPAPHQLEHGWAGLTYLNVVWQEKMVNGMLSSLISSFVVVLIMMIVLFRSIPFGILAMVPLTVTISLIYGLIGLVGKDYDMPVAVLSSLTLGLSVDFAIHFLQRSRQMVAELGGWRETVAEMFKEPARAISRNAITISIGFTPLLLAPLVPYKTVGFFLATIMAVSWMATLFLLTALVTMFRRRLFK